MDSASSLIEQICKSVTGNANGALPYQPGATPQDQTPRTQGLKARPIIQQAPQPSINLPRRSHGKGGSNNPSIHQSNNPGTTVGAVIPCFNEARTIGALVSRLRRCLEVWAARQHRPTPVWIVVVDDGSTDGTALKAENAGAIVLRHDRNRGKGAALQTGLSHLHNLVCEWAVTLDGDGQHDPDDLPTLLQCAEQSGARLIVGNRMDNADSMPWLRRFVNRWMSHQLSQYAGRPLPDTQSGFRLIHLQTWADLPLTAQRFEIESEMLMTFLAANHAVEFVPVRVIPAARKSRIRPITDSLRWLRWWASFARSPRRWRRREMNSLTAKST
jgi:glycosyltransferase involved in cell wall biosynthesis